MAGGRSSSRTRTRVDTRGASWLDDGMTLTMALAATAIVAALITVLVTAFNRSDVDKQVSARLVAISVLAAANTVLVAAFSFS